MSNAHTAALLAEVHKDIEIMNGSIQEVSEFYKRNLDTTRMDLTRMTKNPAMWKKFYDIENRSCYKNRPEGISIYDEFVLRDIRIIGDFIIKYAYTQLLLEHL